MSRRALELRQQDVLQSLLSGRVPDGFDARSAGLTTRVLQVKRRSEAREAAPGLAEIDDLADRFDAWAAEHPRRGCAHDDVVAFVTEATGRLPEPFASIRSIERVYRRETRWGRDRRAGQRRWVVATAGRVWHVGPRARR